MFVNFLTCGYWANINFFKLESENIEGSGYLIYQGVSGGL